MKSIKYLSIIIICSILFLKPSANEESKVKINLSKEEVAITFILNDRINALYIQEKDKNSLVILDYKHEEEKLESNLKDNGIYTLDNIYTVTPVVLKLFNKESKYIKTENNLIVFNFYSNNFCIYLEEYQNEPDLKKCRFL